MKLKQILVGAAIALTAMTASFAVSAVQNVEVIIPDYPVVINGTRVNNVRREYPFIWYNGITYFPMTYDDCAYLGVSNNWTWETGNVITGAQSSGRYNEYYTLTGYKGQYLTASVTEGLINVNGRDINNAAQTYPILTFNNVLYFPMTWDWGAEFGWTISFDSGRGLSVSNNGLSYFGQTLSAQDADFTLLKKQLSALFSSLDENYYYRYDYATPEAEEKAVNMSVGYIYPYIRSEIFGSDNGIQHRVNSDPLDRFKNGSCTVMSAYTTEWIIHNVFNAPFSGRTFKNKYYRHDGNYYSYDLATAYTDREVRNMKIVSRNSDGTYNITADSYARELGDDTPIFVARYSICAALKQENGMKYWSFFKVTDKDNVSTAEPKSPDITPYGEPYGGTAYTFEQAQKKAREYAAMVDIDHTELDFWDTGEIEYRSNVAYYTEMVDFIDYSRNTLKTVEISVNMETGECHYQHVFTSSLAGM